ncbi:hypothetical protein BLOT_014514 [Blomia tropicalis]|nr:hypothetical protein BLOT_014514 [Blomia tropicalis]
MSSFLDICRTCLFFTISSAHIVSRHKGVRLTLAQIPSYINVCGANRSMSKIIHRCAVFRSRRGKQLVVPTGPLHMNSAPSASFERIAVDGFGPFHLKNGRKFWGIVVVCLSSRCVRITVLGNSTLSSAIPSLMFVWNSVGRPNLFQKFEFMSFNLNEIEMECENVQVVTNQATTSSTATQKPITQKIKRAEGAAIWREKNQMANRKEVKKEPNINVSYQDQS